VLLYRTPEQHPWATAHERTYILEGRGGAMSAEVLEWNPGWRGLLKYRQTWAVVLGRFITDPIWWLYVFWLPSYFQEARGFSLVQIGWSAWFPFLCAGVGALSGGWASGHLGLVLFGFQVWVNNLQTLPSDFFPRTAVASVFGLGGTSAAIASVIYNWGTGRVVDSLGYAPMFVCAGLLGPIGLVVTLWLAGRIAPLSQEQLKIRAVEAGVRTARID
jgi:MFS transporter, ACS family, hexuronate transporter